MSPCCIGLPYLIQLMANPFCVFSESLIKFTNAILRSISRTPEETLNQWLNESLGFNVSPYLREEWTRQWGTNVTNTMISSLLKEPKYVDISSKYVYLEPNQRQIELGQLAKELAIDNRTATILPHGTIRLYNSFGAIDTLPKFDTGSYWIQDAAAAIPALALIHAVKQPNPVVVDMCAAPGGKTAQLVASGKFDRVVAIEVSPKRARLLRDNLARLQMNFSDVVIADAQYFIPPNKVAAVLLDAPCSATGTASRRPDVLRKNSLDFTQLLQTQRDLLRHAVDHVLDVGGLLVYATCSLLASESEDQVHCLLADRPNVQTLPIQSGEVPGFDAAIDSQGWMRLLPGHLDEPCDGFFVARLIKISEYP